MKVLEVLLIDVPGEYERVLKAPSSNSRGETNILEAEGGVKHCQIQHPLYPDVYFPRIYNPGEMAAET